MEINIEKEEKRFSSFLVEEDNTNIIFSGIFGIGKTYFIHKFFDNHSDYIPIYLTPVQYSVASNEDIFELIKFDILFQLMEKGVEFDTMNLSFLDSAQWLLHFNIDNFIIKLLQITSKVKLGIDVLSPFIDLKKKIEDYRDKIKRKDEQSLINSFLLQNKDKIGSIYEDNIISQLISSCVLSLKEGEKKIVLVIDDLDRIDPEHIFRILNILSVHENFYGCTGENKFGFDKTILICDITNVRNIYASRYGVNVDFHGYVDKFYSKRVYQFDNRDEIIDQISLLLGSIQSDRAELETPSCTTYKACKVILSALVKNNKLNTRDLLKIEAATIKNNRKIETSNYSIWVSNYPCLFIMDFVRSIFCTIEDMENAIVSLKDNDVMVKEHLNFLTTFLILADFERHYFKEGDYDYLGIKYKIEPPRLYVSTFKSEEYLNNKELIASINKKDIIIKSFTNYQKYFL